MEETEAWEPTKKDATADARLLKKHGIVEDALFDDDDGRGKKKGEDWTVDEDHGGKEDRWFDKLSRAMADDPERIGMYQKAGKCLWMTDPSLLMSANPKCRRCGAQCLFEFQVLPSLLYLGGEYGLWSREEKRDSVSVAVVLDSAALVNEREEDGDIQEESPAAVQEVLGNVQRLEEGAVSLSPLPEFGVVAVYSCSQSCTGDSSLEEHVIVQMSI